MATIINKRKDAVDFNNERHMVKGHTFKTKVPVMHTEDGVKYVPTDKMKEVSVTLRPIVQTDGGRAAIRLISNPSVAEWVKEGESILAKLNK